MIVSGLIAAGLSWDDSIPAILTAVVVIGVAVVLFLAARSMGKRLRQPDQAPVAGFSLQDLRRLVKEGKLSDEEFEQAKQKVLDAHKRAAAVKPAKVTETTKQMPPIV